MDRTQKIRNASIIATIGNSVLAILKIISGLVFGSLALLGDGIDTATDIVTSLVTLVTTKIMEKKPNPKYVYGYKRADAVSAKVLSFVIFFAGAQLAFSTIMKFIHFEERAVPSSLALIVTLISIIGKIFLSWNQFHIGRLTNSSMLIANAKNMRNDILISCSVLIGLFVTIVFNLPIVDMIIALFVSAFIMKTAFEIFRETKTELMDGVDDPLVYEKIIKIVCSFKEIANPHRIRLRKIGDMIVVSLDIEVDGKISVSKSHKIVSKLEDKIISTLGNVYDVRTHVEPVGSFHKNEKYGVDESVMINYCRRKTQK